MTVSLNQQTELNQLAESLGMEPDRNFIENPGKSIPLYHEIRGRKGYRAKLKRAAVELYGMMYSSDILQGAVGRRLKAGSDDWYDLPPVPKLKKWPSDENLTALMHLLHSLAHCASQPTANVQRKRQDHLYVAVPMSRDAYKVGLDMAHISATAMRNMVAALCTFRLAGGNEPWLHLVPKNYNPETGLGKKSRVMPSDAFKDWLSRMGLVFYLHPDGLIRKPGKASKGLLWLNTTSMDAAAPNEDEIELLDRELEGDERILPELNRALVKQKLTIPLSCYDDYLQHWDYSKNRSKLLTAGAQEVYRQFKSDGEWGGRLYGHFVQKLPKAARSLLLIDGVPTVELDYSSMQLRLLYAAAGKSMPGIEDLYVHPDYCDWPDENRAMHREDMKLVLTRSVGCATKGETINSLQFTFRLQNRKDPVRLAERMYEKFWELHAEVSPRDANVAAWTWLQKMDSQIALRVLSKLMDHGIAGIPIHDSFIVQKRYEEQLEAAMTEAFAAFAPEVDCKIG